MQVELCNLHSYQSQQEGRATEHHGGGAGDVCQGAGLAGGRAQGFVDPQAVLLAGVVGDGHFQRDVWIAPDESGHRAGDDDRRFLIERDGGVMGVRR